MMAPARAASTASVIPTTDAPLEVAITVDDLPRHGQDVPSVTRLAIHQKMLDAFAKHRVPEVYGFVNAQKLEGHPEDRAALEAWLAAGHPLGNHTYSHPPIDKLSLDAYLADIDRNEAILRELAAARGQSDATWKVFRYPFLREGTDLASRAKIREHLASRGYRIAEVTIDFYDWAFNNPYARCLAKKDERSLKALRETFLENARVQLAWSDATAKALFGRRVKQVLLLHVGPFDAEMIDAMLTEYEKAGVRFVSFTDAMTDPIYRDEPKVPASIRGHFFFQIMKSRGGAWPMPAPLQPDDLLDAICR